MRLLNANPATPAAAGSFTVAYTATAVCSTGNPAPLGARSVRFEATSDCNVWIGANVAASLTSSNGMLLRVPTYGQTFTVVPGDLVTVVQNTAAGSLNCTWVGA